MALAYLYADTGGEGQMPEELELLYYIDRFGAQAVLGRPIGAGEARRMALADRVMRAYKERSSSENWAEWANKNPDKNRLLIRAMEAAEEYGE